MATKSFNESTIIETQEDADRLDVLLEEACSRPCLDIPSDFCDKVDEGKAIIKRGIRV